MDNSDWINELPARASEPAKQLQDITSALAGKSEIHFPAVDDLFTAAVGDLSGNMKGMISALSRIGSIANADGSALPDDVEEINDCLSRIFVIFNNTYKYLLSGEDRERGFSKDIPESISESGSDPASESRHGKLVRKS